MKHHETWNDVGQHVGSRWQMNQLRGINLLLKPFLQVRAFGIGVNPNLWASKNTQPTCSSEAHGINRAAL